MNELVLRDIHLPDVALWWPPAPGWWLLSAILIVLCFIGSRLWRWLRQPSIRQQARCAFKQIKRDFHQHQDQRRLVTELSTLLRRTAMSYQGREQTAGLTGSAWADQLTELVKTPCFSEDQQTLLIHGQYAPIVNTDTDALINSCEHWIKALSERRSSRVST